MQSKQLNVVINAIRSGDSISTTVEEMERAVVLLDVIVGSVLEAHEVPGYIKNQIMEELTRNVYDLQANEVVSSKDWFIGMHAAIDQFLDGATGDG